MCFAVTKDEQVQAVSDTYVLKFRPKAEKDSFCEPLMNVEGDTGDGWGRDATLCENFIYLHSPPLIIVSCSLPFVFYMLCRNVCWRVGARLSEVRIYAPALVCYIEMINFSFTPSGAVGAVRSCNLCMSITCESDNYTLDRILNQMILPFKMTVITVKTNLLVRAIDNMLQVRDPHFVVLTST